MVFILFLNHITFTIFAFILRVFFTYIPKLHVEVSIAWIDLILAGYCCYVCLADYSSHQIIFEFGIFCVKN